MSDISIPAYHFNPAGQQPTDSSKQAVVKERVISSHALAESITRGASKQTYYTIRLFVDRPLVADAYRAYAYFRWLDDMLDQGTLAQPERLAFLTRQQEIITASYRSEPPADLCPEERLVADLIRGNPAPDSGLQTYISQMMAVMAFDTQRKGRLISQAELTEYTRCLATAVTEALHYFIDSDGTSPQGETRYLAVTAAHITHMLRDTVEDTAVGYYNIPRDFLEARGIAPADVNSEAYRSWVRSQVQLARACFAAGKAHLAQSENLRLRLAGYAYIGRFEVVLDAIERDDYRLRSAYPERKSKRAALRLGLTAMWQAFTLPRRRRALATGSHSAKGISR